MLNNFSTNIRTLTGSRLEADFFIPLAKQKPDTLIQSFVLTKIFLMSFLCKKHPNYKKNLYFCAVK